MANDVSYLKIISIDERKDRETGEIRIYATCEELLPRQHNINLSRQSAAYIQQLKSLVGQNVIMQTREGIFNDRAFLSVNGPMIIPTTVAPVSSPVSVADDLSNDDGLPKNPSPSNKPLFGKGA